MPLSVYQFGLSMKSRQSLRILSVRPDFSTTLLIGRLLLGCPNCLHSEPMAVYITVSPSCFFKAIALAAKITHILDFLNLKENLLHLKMNIILV